jgi:hypothetical protein
MDNRDILPANRSGKGMGKAMQALIHMNILPAENGSQNDYVQDDIARGLRACLVEILSCTLADEAQPDFIKGVLALARRQADLYGIPWHDIMQSLCEMPELNGLVAQLQECTQHRPTSSSTAN